MQSYQQPDHTNTNETGSGKRSIRVTDNFDLAANRETDLEEGPLLLNIGHGFAPEDSGRLQHLPDLQDAAHLPNTSGGTGAMLDLDFPLQPEIHDAAYAETIVQSESSHGKSFSLFTDATLSTGQQNHETLDLSLLRGVGDFSGRNPNKHTGENLDITTSEYPTIQQDSTTEILAIVPWKFEFSWDDGQLVYGSDPFTSQAFDTLSQDRSRRTVDATASSHSTYIFDVDSINYYSTEGSIRNSHAIEPDKIETTAVTMKYALEEALHQGVIDELWHDFRERIISIVDDHYWRTHASQRSNEKTRKSEQRNDNSAAKSSHHGRVTKACRSRTRKHHKDSCDDSEDENSDDGHQLNPEVPMSQPGHEKRRVACPFFKNNPDGFKNCNLKGFRRISEVKAHLLDKHEQHHCPCCFDTLTREAQSFHKCSPQPFPGKVNFLRREALDYLKNRVPREQGSQDEQISKQWWRLYEVIFSDAIPPFPDPFVEPRIAGAVRKYERYLMQQIPALAQYLAEPHPIEAFATPAEKAKAIQEALQTWNSRMANAYIYNDIELDTADSPQVNNDEPILQNIGSVAGDNHQSTYAYHLDSHQLQSPTSCTLDTVGAGPNNASTNANNQSTASMMSAFPTEQGWDDTLPFLDSFNCFQIDLDTTYGLDKHVNSFPGEHNELFPSPSNTTSNELSGPWYPGASHHMENGTLGFVYHVGEGSEHIGFNEGCGDQDYYPGL